MHAVARRSLAFYEVMDKWQPESDKRRARQPVLFGIGEDDVEQLVSTGKSANEDATIEYGNANELAQEGLEICDSRSLWQRGRHVSGMEDGRRSHV